MAKKIIVILNTNLDENQVEAVNKAISSNFVNIRAAENFFLVYAEDNITSREIYDKIKAKLKETISFMVIEIYGSWYGNLYREAIDWVKEKYPNERFYE